MPGPADSLLSLACLAIVPFLVGRAIDPSIGWPARAWAGAVLVGIIILSGHALRLPPILALGVAALVGIVSLLVSRHEPDQAAPLSPREKRLLAALLILLVPPTVSAVLLALHGPVPEGDGLVLWYAKTRGAFFWDSISSGPLPAYPELGPVLWMLPLRVVGLEYENLGRALLPLVWCGWGISLLGVPGRPLDLPALAGAGLASLLVLDPVGLTNGYQDALVLLTAGFAAATMVRFLLRADTWPTRSALLATGMLTGSTALVKQEGMIWSLILGITFLVAILGRPTQGSRRGAVRVVAPFVATWISASALWPALLWWTGVDVALQEGAFTTGSILRSLVRLDRWSVIRPFFADYFVWHGPQLLGCLVVSAAVVGFTPAYRRIIGWLWTVLALHLAFVLLVFLSTRLDLAWHLQTAFGRLAGQGDFVYSLVVLVGTVALGRAVGERRLRMNSTPPAAIRMSAQ